MYKYAAYAKAEYIIFQMLLKTGAEKETCNMNILDVEESIDSAISKLNWEESISAPEKVNINRVNLETKNPSILEKPKSSDNLCDEDDTFCLTKESSLFLRISRDGIIPKVTDQTPECQIVSVKEGEVPPSVLCGRLPSDCHFVTVEHDIEYKPLPVEVVELIETELDADPEYTKDDHEHDYKLKPLSRLLCENRKKKHKSESFSMESEHSLLLEMQDRINLTEETIVTACDLTSAHNINEKSLNEITLRKEIKMLRTYHIIGDYQKIEPNIAEVGMCCSFYGSDKETDDVLKFSDDEGNPKEDCKGTMCPSDDEDRFSVLPVSASCRSAVEVGSF